LRERRVATDQLLVEAYKTVVVVFFVIKFALRISLEQRLCFFSGPLFVSNLIILLLLLLSQLAHQFVSIPVFDLLALALKASFNNSVLIGAPLAILLHFCSLFLVLLFGISDLGQVVRLLLL